MIILINNLMIQPTKEFNSLLGFVGVLSIVSFVLILLYGSKRSKLGFNYDVSNKDDLALNGYFREKLSIMQKIKFLFLGDADSTAMDEMSGLVDMSGGYDPIPGDTTKNIFTPPPQRKNDGKTTLRKFSNFMLNPNNRKMSIFWIVILILSFIFIFGISVFFQHFIVKACNNDTMSSITGGLLSFNLITFGHIGSFILTVCLFMFSMKQNYAGDTGLENQFHHDDATRKTLLGNASIAAKQSLDALKAKLDSTLALAASMSYSKYENASKFFSDNYSSAINIIEALYKEITTKLNAYINSSSSETSNPTFATFKENVKSCLEEFSKACLGYLAFLRSTTPKNIGEGANYLEKIISSLTKLTKYCKDLNIPSITSILERLMLLFTGFIGIISAPTLILFKQFMSYFSFATSTANVDLRQNNFNKTVNKYVTEYEQASSPPESMHGGMPFYK